MSTATRPKPARAQTAPPSRPRRALLLTLASFVAFVLVALAAAYSPLFDVEHVEVEGAAPERIAAVRDAAGVRVGDSILTFLPGSVAGRVRGLPWVATASVTRDLPATVRIRVTERVPVAWVVDGDRTVVVDGTGRVLWRAEAPSAGLPELVGASDVPAPGAGSGPWRWRRWRRRWAPT